MPQLPSPSGSSDSSDSRDSESGDADGDAQSGIPNMPAGEGGPNSASGEGELSQGSILSGGPLQTGGPVDGSEGNEGEEAGGQNQVGSDGLEVGLLPSGDQAGEETGDDGWEISNELPVLEGGRRQGDEEAEGVLAGLPDDGTLNGEIEDAELERTLGDLDGSILAERNSEIEKANDRAVASGLPDVSDENAADAGGDGSVSQGTSTAPNEVRVQPQGGIEGGQARTVVRATVDTPDARDENVIARQLREAAMAEEDPELRANLWEEYERYTGKKK